MNSTSSFRQRRYNTTRLPLSIPPSTVPIYSTSVISPASDSPIYPSTHLRFSSALSSLFDFFRLPSPQRTYTPAFPPPRTVSRFSTTHDQCKLLWGEFSCLCQELALADEKTVGTVTCITYLGYEFDSELMEIRIPQDEIIDILQQIEFILSKSRVSLRQLQSLTGSLAFCTKAMPSAQYSLPDCWPHLVQFVAHLSKFKKCAFSTINAYLSGISFVLKLNYL
ncbi:hypothetical protein MAR_006601 [Mya arenaria]|uniref:Uncharacterized protein n=1 Tax=Mya arenaria TaxID=6604 RepID=A0ABY7DGK6_MYAAR|nr:hypothetical protein MAR_006601 [Mya arenaria]